jgi:hypothetical protein
MLRTQQRDRTHLADGSGLGVQAQSSQRSGDCTGDCSGDQARMGNSSAGGTMQRMGFGRHD